MTGEIATHTTALGLHPLPDAQRGPHLLGVQLPDAILADVLPGLAAANCFAAVRGTTLRIAPHLHITDDDIERLLRALDTVTTTGG